MDNLMFNTAEEKEQVVTDFLDPFKGKHVKQIWLIIDREPFLNKKDVDFRASVQFRNGNTKGEQDITADDFPTLLHEVESFIKSLDQ